MKTTGRKVHDPQSAQTLRQVKVCTHMLQSVLAKLSLYIENLKVSPLPITISYSLYHTTQWHVLHLTRAMRES
jgi:hypothetical protein